MKKSNKSLKKYNPWNKGLTQETDERVKRSAKKRRGRIVYWNRRQDYSHIEDFDEDKKLEIISIYLSNEYCSITKLAELYHTWHGFISQVLDDFSIKHKTRQDLFYHMGNPFYKKRHTKKSLEVMSYAR